MSIVGNELTSVERVTGKLTSARAAAAGAASGAWLGLFLGLVTFLFSPVPNFSSVVGAVIIGVGFGAIYGIVSYSITRRRRDFTSVMQVTATSYSVVVEPDSLNRARNVLGIGGASTSVHGEPVVETPPDPPAAPTSRPVGRYGERVPEQGGPDAPEPTAPPTSTDRPVGEQGAPGA
ncbi:general stress protein [Clavibacter zhangzhiyongii]|uniref:general stress protein n=1 Tax=Clavibacter zhangzhiyongii TaxID=2768071 RepID=UPI0039DFCE99